MSAAEDMAKWTTWFQGVSKEAVGVLAEDVYQTIRERTPVETGALRDAWKKTSSGDTHTIGNNKEYATVVEFGLYPNPPKGGAGKTQNGFSTQAPRGMVGITMLEVPDKLASAIKKVTK